MSKEKGTLDEIVKFCSEIGLPMSDAEYLFYHWESTGWINGRNHIKDWKATIRSWKAAGYLPSLRNKPAGPDRFDPFEPKGWRHYLCQRYPGVDFYHEWKWIPRDKQMEAQRALRQ